MNQTKEYEAGRSVSSGKAVNNWDNIAIVLVTKVNKLEEQVNKMQQIFDLLDINMEDGK